MTFQGQEGGGDKDDRPTQTLVLQRCRKTKSLSLGRYANVGATQTHLGKLWLYWSATSEYTRSIGYYPSPRIDRRESGEGPLIMNSAVGFLLEGKHDSHVHVLLLNFSLQQQQPALETTRFNVTVFCTPPCPPSCEKQPEVLEMICSQMHLSCCLFLNDP